MIRFRAEFLQIYLCN